jgi:hypothetical protein
MGAAADVTALSSANILIRFKGKDGNKDLPLITLENPNLTGDPGAQITITTQVNGISSEIQINDTTANDQMYPSVAVGLGGDFVVSWTSYGQDGDTAWESNIYAKQLIANDYLRQSNQQTSLLNQSYSVNASTWVVTTDSPANHVVQPNTGYDGVVQVIVDMGPLGQGFGTGTLLLDRFHVLTAAHVVADDTGQLASTNISVMFNLASGNVVIPAIQVIIHPDYTGDPFVSPDLAIITLSQAAPAGVTGFDIYRSTDEIGQVFEFYGYGLSGDGNTGAVLPYGIKRQGENTFEAYGNQLVPAFNPNLLAYDFDNGLAANDAFGILLGITNLGLGAAEACGAPGDSGGPSFIGGKIAAVTTGGVAFPGPDLTGGVIDSSFGDTGYHTRVSVYANWIDSVVLGGSGPEFLVNQITDGQQKWSSVAVDADGDFVIAWTSYGQDGTGSGPGAGVNGENGIYARRFDSTGAAVSNEFKVNTTSAYNQQHPQVAMDADGDFVIIWESYQDRPSSTSGLPDLPNSYGIYAQRYVATSKLGTISTLGVNGELGSEFRLNATIERDQRYPSIAMDANGDLIAVWTGEVYDTTSLTVTTDVFSQRYNKSADDTGPFVTEVQNLNAASAALEAIYDSSIITGTVTTFVITFDENLTTTGGPGGTNSITNLSNWRLTQDNVILSNAISSVKFGLNKAYELGLSSKISSKYEAVVTFDSDMNTSGSQALNLGEYSLTILSNVRDIFGNALDGNLDGAPGDNFVFNFTLATEESLGPQVPDTVTPPGDPTENQTDTSVNRNKVGDQSDPAVASNSIGEHVVVWVTDTDTNSTDIMFLRYDKYGRAVGTETLVCSVAAGAQVNPDVAMDPLGNFVVVWAGYGTGDDYGIYARLFDTFGKAQGEQFRVNQYRINNQDLPSVAMDANGDFLVTWTSYGQDGDKDGVYARRYNKLGQALSSEFRVNTTTKNRQDSSDVAMDTNGNFVVIWESDQQDGSSWGIYGQRYNSSGQAVGSEFRVNTYTTDKQIDPHVAMDASGDFIVVWSSFNQDGSGYGVYARRYNSAGTALNASEFRVNQTAVNWQLEAAVSTDYNGNFVVVWTAFGQDDELIKDYGVYARLFNANGSDRLNSSTGLAYGEFCINATTLGDQRAPDVAMDSDGDFVVVWVGPDSDSTGIYSRVVALNLDSYTPVTAMSSTGQFKGVSQSDSNTTSTYQTINGTTGNDVIEFYAAASAGQWIVKVNGATQTVNAQTTSLNIDGLAGTDTITIYGTSGDDTAELWSNQASFVFAAFSLTAVNVEKTVINGGSGSDTATIHDSTGNDVLQAGYGFASMTYSGGNSATANGFEKVVVQSSSGSDVAYLYGAAKSVNTFVVSPTEGRFYGTGFDNNVTGFKNVQAYGTGGSSDTATFTDSTGDDTFVASRIGAGLSGTGFNVSAWSFRQIAVTGSEGNDKAVLYGSVGGADTFVASPTTATYTGTNFVNTVNNFDHIQAYADPAGNATATLIGSTGNDYLVVSPIGAALSGTGFDNSAWSFRHVIAKSRGGSDTAHVYGTSGSDTFSLTPTVASFSGGGVDRQVKSFSLVVAHGEANDTAYFYDSSTGADAFTATASQATMIGTGYENRAKGFGNVQAYATPGGGDTASFEGSTGVDKLIASPYGAGLRGTDYNNSAWSFSEVQVDAGEGQDKAVLYGSATGPDTYLAYPSDVTLSGTGFSNQAVNFESVQAYTAVGNKSTATFYDTTGYEQFVASPVGAQMKGTGFDNSAWNFGAVRAYSSGGNDIAFLYDSSGDDQLEADDQYAALSNGSFSNRVDNFARVRAKSSGGVDRATLDNAFIETGLTTRALSGSEAQYSKMLWLMDFDELWTTEKPTQSTPQAQAVDSVMSAYW